MLGVSIGIVMITCSGSVLVLLGLHAWGQCWYCKGYMVGVSVGIVRVTCLGSALVL